jgi:predicted patatin/cPLA2 family phospholipase
LRGLGSDGPSNHETVPRPAATGRQNIESATKNLNKKYKIKMEEGKSKMKKIQKPLNPKTDNKNVQF